MWDFIARTILKYRAAYTAAILIITVFMARSALNIQFSFEFAKVLPVDDPTYVEYEGFKKKFGEDGNVMVAGFADSSFFQKDKFNDWFRLSEKVNKLNGIKEVLSVTHLYDLQLNDSLGSLKFERLIDHPVETQAELDSIKDRIHSLPMYEGLVYSKDRNTTLMAITFHNKDLNSRNRIDLTKNIKAMVDSFGVAHNLEMHYSGMPFIRSEFMAKVSTEMKLFLALAALVISIILLIIFRSFKTLMISLGTVIIGVIWALGSIYLMGYKITILSGLIPPLILIIGIPNCVFLINKFHREIAAHGQKTKALYRTIKTIGLSLFLANITTAIGFGVFYFTDSPLLLEFGVVAAMNVMATYFITLILIPIILSLLSTPSRKKTGHLESKAVTGILSSVDRIVHTRRNVVYILTTVLVLISAYGMSLININGFVVDDLPKDHPIYRDLRFFESKLGGVLPFEIMIDTKKQDGVIADDGKTIYKIKALQNSLKRDTILSRPLSIVEIIRFGYQAYKDGNPKYYILPSKSELKELAKFKAGKDGKQLKEGAFMDSARQVCRISYQIKDIGSDQMEKFVGRLTPTVDSIFEPSQYKVSLTGHSLVFLKNNSYLLGNLFESLLIEIILVTLVGMFLFKSIRIILLSKLPCLIPLVITAGIMGYFQIDFKPSTILIFTIAFGISSDSTIYFLTKYREELKAGSTKQAGISKTITEIGVSMIYSTVILFFGFGVFAFSGFGGTVALGILVSTTLLVSLFTNLILLPSILLSLENYISKKELTSEELIEIPSDREEKV